MRLSMRSRSASAVDLDRTAIRIAQADGSAGAGRGDVHWESVCRAPTGCGWRLALLLSEPADLGHVWWLDSPLGFRFRFPWPKHADTVRSLHNCICLLYTSDAAD